MIHIFHSEQIWKYVRPCQSPRALPTNCLVHKSVFQEVCCVLNRFVLFKSSDDISFASRIQVDHSISQLTHKIRWSPQNPMEKSPPTASKSTHPDAPKTKQILKLLTEPAN